MRRSLVTVSVVALGALGLPVSAALAATPDAQSVTVPTSTGQTRTVTWTGEIPPGSNPTSDCDTNTALADIETLTVNVPSGAYQQVSASFTFSIHWTPVSPDETTNDEILTVVNT